MSKINNEIRKMKVIHVLWFVCQTNLQRP